MKKKESKKVLVPQGTFVNSQRAQLHPIIQSTKKIKPTKNETI